MDWGMKNRLSGILKPRTGRCVMLAVDHGYFQGPTSGLERPGETVAPLLPHADALMLTRGALRNTISAEQRIPIGRALGELRAPIVFATATTLCGFLGFLISSNPGLRSVGIVGAIGFATVLTATLVFFPAVMQLIASHR